MRASAPERRVSYPRVSLKILTSAKTIKPARSMAYRTATLAVALAASAQVFAQQGNAPAGSAPPVSADEKGPMTIDAERIQGVGEMETSARGSAEIKQDEL